ncbi:hypothetical protein [Rhizorhabdus histidinilytica]|uniref:hypothetical protein n=1 Tax=Rhizorhabdus histidinilytica TaxID=439228 RepID=UPI00063F06CD|nr:hypothetical protein [Sphingomonas sp. Y57]
MISAGYLTAGGLAVVAGGLLFYAALLLGDSLAEAIGRFFDVRGEWAGYGPADAGDDGASLVHAATVEPEAIAAASGKSAGFTAPRPAEGARHG